ncbi:site-specific recombinase [Ideonella sp.]|uniref:site-specific recombinase n=1 Tax=Ideonella sp. TaxID=1929293 RepID=UPI002B46A863|nr:site-specific recombinase [Ideonella sp.]HJV68936.1 site-specific recombinase [Ideonella sp.]
MVGPRARWDLSALLNAADPRATAAEQHLWLVRWLQWLRSPGPDRPGEPTDPSTPWPVQRLRLFVDVAERHPEYRERLGGLWRATFSRLDATGLLADFGFAPRHGFLSEFAERLRLGWLPGTPQTDDLGALFPQLFSEAADADWLAAIDEGTLERLLALVMPSEEAVSGQEPWRPAMVESIQLLASQMRASGLSGPMRQRMDAPLLADRPFHQVVQAAEALRAGHLDGDDAAARLQQAAYLRAVLDACRQAAASVRGHLDEHGISVDLVFQIDQLRERGDRIEALLACLVSDLSPAAPAIGGTPAPAPAGAAPELRALLVGLVQCADRRRSLIGLFRRHYALLARKVTERSAETGEHYITRTRAEYRTMLAQACGGGAVIGLTTLLKFALGALALSAFWAGFAAGLNYAASFVLIYLLHWTVATKQPAMTAPAMAAKLEGVSASDEAVEGFVDEVAHLLRTQVAGIVGNLALVVPVVLAVQGLAWWLAGAPVVGEEATHHVLHSLHLLGPTLLYAAFTGVLLFASSLIAGWVENWFVFHRLDSAIAWNPAIRDRLGPERAMRWSRWWRQHISGLAANVSLGLMLGLVPAIGAFFGLGLEVRHVTLAMGQLAAALGALGPALLHEPDFWWCLAAIPLVGLLNLGVSFTLAFRVALASRGLRVRDRGRLYAALRRRFRQAPASFVVPPAEDANATEEAPAP